MILKNTIRNSRKDVKDLDDAKNYPTIADL